MGRVSEEAKRRKSEADKARRQAKAESEGRAYILRGPAGEGRAKRVRQWTPGSDIVIPENDPL